MQPLNNGSVPPKSWFSRSTTDNVLNALPGKTPEQQTKLVRGLLQHLIDNPKSDTLARLKQVADICPEILKSELRYRVSHAPQQNSPVVATFRAFLNEPSSMVAANPATTAVSAPPPTITRVNPDRLKTGSGDSNDYAASAPPRSTSSTGISQSVPYRAASPVYNPNEDDSDVFGDSSRISNPDGIVAVSTDDVWAMTSDMGVSIQAALDLDIPTDSSPPSYWDVVNEEMVSAALSDVHASAQNGDIMRLFLSLNAGLMEKVWLSDVSSSEADSIQSQILSMIATHLEVASPGPQSLEDPRVALRAMASEFCKKNNYPTETVVPIKIGDSDSEDDEGDVSTDGAASPVLSFNYVLNPNDIDSPGDILDAVNEQLSAEVEHLSRSGNVTMASLIELNNRVMSTLNDDYDAAFASAVQVGVLSAIAESLGVVISIPAAPEMYSLPDVFQRMVDARKN